MSFRVGQKVICVDITNGNLGDLKKGCVYTVRETGLRCWFDDYTHPCIRIEEIVRKHSDPLWNDFPYWEHRFRPIVERKTDISVFTKILNRTNLEAEVVGDQQ